ncbi:unnamed protein product, partial [Oppiella nova]
IKKYYFRELDNDYYVFGCKWSGCEFVTNNSGSIRRHVHNQHLCPHSVANNYNNSGDQRITSQSVIVHNSNISTTSSFASEQPLVEIIELDPQSIIPKLDESDGGFDGSNSMSYSKPIDLEIDMEANPNGKSSTGGLYSLKNYSDLYRKVKVDGEVYFKCNCNQFTTKS